jgi:WhiB family redox-sensing transcriptional regulator
MSARRGDRWEDQALCRTADPDLFHPAGVGTAAKLAYLPAKAWCARCPVREVCLDSEMAREGSATAGNRYGVRGGLDPAERAELYRRQRRAQAEECAA